MAGDILQFVIYGALLLLLAYPLGTYMARVFSGERTWLTPALAPVERLLYRACGVGAVPGGQHWTAYAKAVLIFNLVGLAGALCDPAPAGPAALEPAGLWADVARPRLQHGGELRHQHQLAGLWRRDDAVLFQPDGRADGAEFRLGGDRHRRRRRRDPRLRRAAGQGRRQFLGRSDPQRALRAAAAFDHRGAVPGLAGRAAEPRRATSTRRRSKAASR